VSSFSFSEIQSNPRGIKVERERIGTIERSENLLELIESDLTVAIGVEVTESDLYRADLVSLSTQE